MAVGPIVIVGAGLSGLRTAERLRRLGHTGPVTLVGEEQHLPYDRPPMSKTLLTQADAPAPPLLRPAEKYADLDLDVRRGVRVTSVDTAARALSLDDGSSLVYDRLVVATGARARNVPAWSPYPNVHTLRTFDDCLALHAALHTSRHVTVIGAGVLGSEIASSARTLGLAVTLVEGLPQPLVRVVGAELGEVVADLHREHGVDLRLGVGVDRLEGTGRVSRVLLADGSAVDTDLVVVAIGSIPETDWLAGSGILVEDGVVCDAAGASSAPGVYAVGDAARMPHPGSTAPLRLEHWTSAGETAALVAANLLAGPDEQRPLAEVPYFWSDQYDVKVQALGVPAPSDEVLVVTGDTTERKFLAVATCQGSVTAAIAMNMPAALARCRLAVSSGLDVATLVEQAPWERKKAAP